MTDPLTTEQIELLRGLPVPCLDVRDVSQAESFAQMHKCGLVYAPPILPYNGEHEWRRLESADTLLATIDRQGRSPITESSQSPEPPEGGLAAAEAVECLADKYSGATETVTVYRMQIVAELRDLAKSLAANLLNDLSKEVK